MPESPVLAHADVVREVRMIRRAGIVRLRKLALPVLTAAAGGPPGQAHAAGDDGEAVERLLRRALARLDPGSLRTAAALSLGLADGTRDWPAADRRRRAAAVYGVSIERFRKHQELVLFEQLADAVLHVAEARVPPGSAGTGGGTAGPAEAARPGTGDPRAAPAAPAANVPGARTGSAPAASGAPAAAAGTGPSWTAPGRTDPDRTGPAGADPDRMGAAGTDPDRTGPAGTDPPGGGPAAALAAAHRRIPVTVGGRSAELTLHVHPVDVLRDVDVVFAPANTYLVPSHLFKSSVSAALRRAAAVTDATGRVLRDSVAEELAAWTAAHSTRGRPVVAGTVVPTGAGTLAAQGVRRLYHAALAVPRPGTNDYDVEPADVTRAVARGFALLAAEANAFTPPLRSICFPLAGAGRGGLSPEASLAAVWTAVEAELARGAYWRVHLVVRRPANGDLVQRLLEARR